MNYLAHAFLSFGKPEIITGNLIADFVKGKKQYSFDRGIQQGIRLHRAIDAFTDDHDVTRQAKRFFVPACGRYSGAFLDVVYDHFLATDAMYFDQVSLDDFSTLVYQVIDSSLDVLPERFRVTFHYMKKQNWLAGYAEKKNIFNAFRGIYHRAEYLNESDDAYLAFEKYYDELQHSYHLFMPDLVFFASAALERQSE